MYALIFSGLIIANGSAVLFGTDTMSPGFIMGGFVAVIGIVFGFLTVHCPHCGKLLNLKGWDTEYCSHCGESVVLEKAEKSCDCKSSKEFACQRNNRINK